MVVRRLPLPKEPIGVRPRDVDRGRSPFAEPLFESGIIIPEVEFKFPLDSLGENEMQSSSSSDGMSKDVGDLVFGVAGVHGPKFNPIVSFNGMKKEGPRTGTSGKRAPAFYYRYASALKR